MNVTVQSKYRTTDEGWCIPQYVMCVYCIGQFNIERSTMSTHHVHICLCMLLKKIYMSSDISSHLLTNVKRHLWIYVLDYCQRLLLYRPFISLSEVPRKGKLKAHGLGFTFLGGWFMMVLWKMSFVLKVAASRQTIWAFNVHANIKMYCEIPRKPLYPLLLVA